jgi:toxin ParE1/3/4
MRLRWSETALAEIEDIFSYIYQNNRLAATAVVERIEGLAALLEEFPLVGHPTDEAGVRVLSVVRYPFLIFYAIDDQAGEIVIHSACAAHRARTAIAFVARPVIVYSAAALRGRPTKPAGSPNRSTMTAARSLALSVTQAPERTA